MFLLVDLMEEEKPLFVLFAPLVAFPPTSHSQPPVLNCEIYNVFKL